jgi:YegS/Rv2252/BmrU family lipid kinase
VKHDVEEKVRKILFIINPVAGKGETIKMLPEIKKYFENFDYEIKISKSVGDATKIAQDNLLKYTDIISVGGDGTLTEIVDGLKKYKGNLGIIPAGTGNDFVRTLGYPSNLTEYFEIIKNEKIIESDVLRVNNHRFINVASFGIDGEVIVQTDKIKKKIPGTWAYILSSLKAITKFKPYPVTITIDEKVMKKEIVLAAVGNGMYFGGGMFVTPFAKIDDGQLDVVIASKTSKMKLINLFSKLYKGRHMDDIIVEHYKCKTFLIESRSDIYINADGNLIGMLPAKVSVEDEKIKILIP